MKIQRYRIIFSKTEAMRFTGHLDLVLTWERTFRRAGLPLSYSEGFNPRPVLNLASPLPLGFISSAEIGDFWLSETIEQKEVQKSLERSLPPGLIIHHIQEIVQIHGQKLPGLVERSEYTASLFKEYADLDLIIDALLQSSKIMRTRKGKEYDLRPLIHNITLDEVKEATPPHLIISLFSLPTGTGRPDEVLAALDIPYHEAIICRTAIILKSVEES